MIWILGPCALENEKMYMKTLSTIMKIMNGRDWYYKSSFDKANRTSIKGLRGVGLKKAIEIFKQAKERYPGIRLTTDVHETHQVEQLVDIIDCIQIPAFLCRQTDLIVECAKHFNKVNIKRGQWLGPNNLAVSVDKIRETNPDCEAWITDRGSNFGYDKLLVDFTIIEELKKYYDKVILDCTHSVQRSRKVYGVQGDRKLAEKYLLASDIFEYDGVFAEVHPTPDRAISNGDCQIYLDRFRKLIRKQELIRKALY
jgi:2-dehydro-3-deoxyphosphooctonate aldolase (KDO 8-P synthase)